MHNGYKNILKAWGPFLLGFVIIIFFIGCGSLAFSQTTPASTYIDDNLKSEEVYIFSRGELETLLDDYAALKNAPIDTPITTPPIGPIKVSKFLTNADIIKATQVLGVDEAIVRAVCEVESAGSGFLSDGQVRILYERHIFHRLTGGIYSLKNPDISSRRTGGYGRAGAWQHTRLQKATRLDRIAGLQSASWGKFQLMGFNYKACGFNNAQSFINAMHLSEGAQLMATANFIKSQKLVAYMRKEDWAGFARRYNGPNYRKNNYDVKLRKAVAKWRKKLKQ